ncbi:MAG: hypothetical protein KJ573_04820 [Proteobacteria bacterium]|jgi:hypothetical protein|nr:hypothetical protein [Pseudomonadota bacterium]MBU0989758.1 hypothetical protein [Pseudomonadota bacterium]MBU1902897.1 hypothetical protein [Pseudomonadota bacterium]
MLCFDKPGRENADTLGGAGRGVDMALILKPANQSDMFDICIREIICKPRNF